MNRLLGGALHWDPQRVEHAKQALFCPHDSSELTRFCPDGSGAVHRCRHCQGLVLEPGMLPVLRKQSRANANAHTPSLEPGPLRSSLRPRASTPAPALHASVPAPSSVRPRFESLGEAQLVGSRLGSNDPFLALLAQPLALLFAWLFTMSLFGRLLAMGAQIQFHELGHALPAWLSSRAALPLPFGMTFIRDEPGVFTGLCVAFLASVVLYRGYVEERRATLLAGAGLLLGWLVLTFGVAPARSRMLVLLGGFVGELCLPALMLVAFHLRLPDRLRWDFFRFLALPFAACAYMGALRLWLGIAHGSVQLPMGSFLPGDGNGDFDRLIAEYGFSQASIIRVGTSCARASVVGLGAHYAWLALNAWRQIRATRNL